jgi:MFS family permease
MAIGILGMGSGLGFFAGPQFAGLRAMSAGWHFGAIADWQRPCIEIGIAGLVVAILFVLLAREARPNVKFHHAPDVDEDDAMLPARISVEAIVTEYTGKDQAHGRAMDPATRRRVIAIAAILGCRDFAGVASLTAVSLYLQKAHGYDVKHAGLIVGAMMLFSILINPLAVYVSPGKRRLPALALCLVSGGIVFALTPAVPVRWAIVILSLFQMCQLGSYAISDAAMLERVDSGVRGRVVGLFLTLAGTFAALSPWAIGSWVDLLGERSHHPVGFVGIFGTLGAMMIIAAFSTPIIARLGESVGEKLAPSPSTLGEGGGEGQLIASK